MFHNSQVYIPNDKRQGLIKLLTIKESLPLFTEWQENTERVVFFVVEKKVTKNSHI